jgi:hypothetical protein
MLRRFALAALSVLCLAAAFHLGHESAGAGAGNFVGITAIPYNSGNGGRLVAITTTGELWIEYGCEQSCGEAPFPTWNLWGVIGGTASVPPPGLQPSTWGQVKGQAR